MTSHDLLRREVAPLLFGKNLVRVLDEYELQTAVADAQAAKTQLAMRKIGELHGAGAIGKQQTLELLVALDSTADYPPPFDQIWSDGVREQTIDYVDQLHKCIRLGAANIAREVARDLYVPPLPARRPGLMERLLVKWGLVDDAS